MLPRLSRINFFDDIFDDSLLKKERNLRVCLVLIM